MHLVRTFKTVELFKVPLRKGISLRMDGRIKRLKKRQDVKKLTWLLAHLIKAVSLSLLNSSDNKEILI